MTIEIADLHTHYPMHLALPDMYTRDERTWLRRVREDGFDAARAVTMKIARRLFNDMTPASGPAVTLERFREGNVTVAFSALYSPFDEIDIRGRFLGAPQEGYFPALIEQLDTVETEVLASNVAARVVTNAVELAAARANGEIAIVHCVEGGFHLGPNAAAVGANVALLKRRGVAYVTVAHLLYRHVATNVAALPFLPDRVYHALFKQPSIGLTPLGTALVRALHDSRVLVDLTHMTARAMEDTLDLLDRLDPGRTMPVIASHIGCRFGALEYNFEDEWIRRIADRDGVMGVILCEHYAGERLRALPTSRVEESLDVVCAHIERIHAVTGSYDHIAIGSDHDGFTKPTLAGLGHPGELGVLAAHLERRYGTVIAKKIASENVLRVLGTVF